MTLPATAPQLPTGLTAFAPPPSQESENFNQDAHEFFTNLCTLLIPEANALLRYVYEYAKYCYDIFEELEAKTTALRASAAVQLSGGNGRLWVANASYKAATPTTAADVVIDPADPATAYRCVADVSGSKTGPRQDTAHWVRLNGLAANVQEAVVDMGAGNIILADRGGVFRKTVTAAVTLQVQNPNPANYTTSGLLELTNGGAFPVTFWPGSRWAYGRVPSLTAAGKDVIGFYTSDGGQTWTLTPIALDAK